MAKIETVAYRCDICGKYVDKETDLSKIGFTPGESFKNIEQKDYPSFPCNILKGLPELQLPRLHNTSFDACNKCTMRIYHFMCGIIASENEEFMSDIFLSRRGVV